LTKVLIADDNKLLLAMTRDALAEAGFAVVTVDSGLEVYKKVLAEKPGLILLDIMMPGLDGIEICRNLKRSPVTRDIVIVFHSGKKDPALMDLAFEAGAEGFLIKSDDFEGLVAKVREIAQEKVG
jgi:two-component system, OmpR family, alkaline phosphatase synthesis response regulator PhoP